MYDDEYNFDEPSPALSAEDIARIAGEEAERRTVQTLQAVAQASAMREAALAQSSAVVRQMRDAAIERAEANYPGLKKLRGNTEVWNRYAVARPRIAEAIENAENGQGTDSLAELYGSFYDSARALGIADTTARKPRDPHTQTVADSSRLSTSQSRQELIRSFEERHGDVSVDLADDSDEEKRVTRY
jgi:hypothetical protein